MKNQRRDFLKIVGVTSLLAAYPRLTLAQEFAQDEDVIFLKPKDKDYEAYRTPFNKRILKQPAVIALCLNEKGVQKAIKSAKALKMKMTIQSGGTSFEGFSLNDGGMVINVNKLDSLEINSENELVAGPGAIVVQANEFLISKGRMIPIGACGSIALGGLTLGGGYGFFSREHGLTSDSLISFTIVDSEGNLHSSIDKPDLAWACRGGGNGNFGVVTQLKYKTFEAPKKLWSYRFRAYKLKPERAVKIAEEWFELSSSLPKEAFSAFVLNGSTLTILVTSYQDKPEGVLTQIISALKKIMDKTEEGKHEELLTALAHYYGRMSPLYFKNGSGGLYKDFEEVRPFLLKAFKQVFEKKGMIYQINTFGGAVNTEKLNEISSFAHRDSNFISDIQCYWDTPSEEKVCMQNMKELQELISSYIKRHYRNYPDLHIKEWEASYYGKNYARLQEIKKEYDGAERFEYAQSIKVSE